MDIKLHNTLTGTKDAFSPITPGKVSMYNCGPTVYDYAHIGNFRTFIMSDVLRRMFEYNGLEVNQVMNITDIDDKTIKRSISEKVSLKELTRKYEGLFFADLAKLNILQPKKTPRAVESIDDIISLIETMLQNGSAYKTSDGIYFNIITSKNYGALAHLNLENATKERVANDEYDKENARDFSLWKFYTPEDGDVSYDAPFGKGRPGWHIECSAMSMKAFGPTLDVHTGGQDLIFPHHTNEIAQSEAVTGKTFANYWVHGGFITIDSKKMSKSLGNIFTLETLREKGIDPLAYRYFVLGAHYTSPLNFTWEALEGARIALKRLKIFLSKNIFDTTTDMIRSASDANLLEKYQTEFLECINNDLDTPKVLALIWEIIKDESMIDEDKRGIILDFDRVLGLDLERIETFEVSDEVQKLIVERDRARAEKYFAKSDELRTQIEQLGFEVMDTQEGTKVEKK